MKQGRVENNAPFHVLLSNCARQIRRLTSGFCSMSHIIELRPQIHRPTKRFLFVDDMSYVSQFLCKSLSVQTPCRKYMLFILCHLTCHPGTNTGKKWRPELLIVKSMRRIVKKWRPEN